ncbi:hypothetical protein [Aliiroseovarius sp.]|uniref:hypothetical protein n=1 Tax=Aliiroseovarius sp. TaxID=1872442 RepID=UPI003BA95566
MKRIIATATLAVVTLTGAAHATSVSMADLGALRGYVSQVEAEALSPTDVRIILNFIHSGDSEGEKRQKVRAFLK